MSKSPNERIVMPRENESYRVTDFKVAPEQFDHIVTVARQTRNIFSGDPIVTVDGVTYKLHTADRRIVCGRPGQQTTELVGNESHHPHFSTIAAIESMARDTELTHEQRGIIDQKIAQIVQAQSDRFAYEPGSHERLLYGCAEDLLTRDDSELPPWRYSQFLRMWSESLLDDFAPEREAEICNDVLSTYKELVMRGAGSLEHSQYSLEDIGDGGDQDNDERMLLLMQNPWRALVSTRIPRILLPPELSHAAGFGVGNNVSILRSVFGRRALRLIEVRLTEFVRQLSFDVSWGEGTVPVWASLIPQNNVVNPASEGIEDALVHNATITVPLKVFAGVDGKAYTATNRDVPCVNNIRCIEGGALLLDTHELC